MEIFNVMRSLTRFFPAAMLVFAAGVSHAFSQASSSTAELRGQVTDSSGAAVPNASVTITDTAKGVSRTTQTDAEGNYVFLNLLPSSYELNVGQQANIPVRLSAQGIRESVEVVAGGEVVDTDRTQQSTVIGAARITNLPISRRNYLDYALLTPGVSDADNIVSKSGANRFHGSAFGLFRHERFDARYAFDFNPAGKSPFSRQRFGGSPGGPVRRDRTFFFTSPERFGQDETTFVDLLQMNNRGRSPRGAHAATATSRRPRRSASPRPPTRASCSSASGSTSSPRATRPAAAC